MEQWYSGLISYPWLLASQFLIIALLSKICVDVTRNTSWFSAPRLRLGICLLYFGIPYLLVMLIRYAIRMSIYPHERWTGGSIPIFFHWVLALFVLTLAAYNFRNSFGSENKVTRVSRLKHGSAIFCISLGILLWATFQLGPWVLGKKLNARASEYAVRIDRRVSFSARDGIELASDVFHPQGLDKTPTILVRIPFSKTLTNSLFANIIGRFWAERGYTVVIQGTRGRYESGGKYEPLFHEREDGLETLRWLAKQKWYNGKIGMWGGSYFGFTQWSIADQIDPGPAGLMIQIASSRFYDMFYPGGAFSLESALNWAAGSYGEKDVSVQSESLRRGYQAFPLIEADDRSAQDIPFFNDWVSHPVRDEYWKKIDGESRVGTLKSPVFLMAGWFDPFLQAQLNDFIEIKTRTSGEIANATRLVVGPWGHARTIHFPNGVTPRNYRLESLVYSVPWFDLLFRSDAAEKDALPPVQLYIMGENIWRNETEWPLKRTEYRPYFLHESQSLDLKAPSKEESFDSFTYDPLNPVPSLGGAVIGPNAGVHLQNSIESRSDLRLYSTSPLENDTEVTGPVRAILYVESSARCTDFTAKLVDVFPDGSAYNISEGISRLSDLRAGTNKIAIDLWPTAIVFLRGHRIRLEISSSNFPRFDRNPNTCAPIATATQTAKATQRIHHRSTAASHVILPVIPRRIPVR